MPKQFEGTPKLEEVVLKITETVLRIHRGPNETIFDYQPRVETAIAAILRPFITPACSPIGPLVIPGLWRLDPCKRHEDYVDSCLACQEEVLTVKLEKAYRAGFKAGATATPASTGEANGGLLSLLEDVQEEFRLIRMKDTNVVYDPTLRARIRIAIANIQGSNPELQAHELPAPTSVPTDGQHWAGCPENVPQAEPPK